MLKQTKKLLGVILELTLKALISKIHITLIKNTVIFLLHRFTFERKSIYHVKNKNEEEFNRIKFFESIEEERYNGNQEAEVEYLFDDDHFLNGSPSQSMPWMEMDSIDENVSKFLRFVLHAYMPFGILKLNVFEHAKIILKNKDDAASEFFKLIPMALMFVPDTKEGKLEMLKRLQEVTEILHSGIKNSWNALEYFYKNYFPNVDITLLPDGESENIRIRNSIGDRYDIRYILKCERNSENDNEGTKDRTSSISVFHVTYPNNILGILKDGLLPRSNLPHVKVTGNLSQGDGIYFWGEEGLRKFIDLTFGDFSELVIFYCTIASGQFSIHRYYQDTEYVVTDKTQVKIDYLIKIVKN